MKSFLSTVIGDIRSYEGKLGRGTYEPTGLQEDIIRAVGNAEPGITTIILAADPNQVGKTTTVANIIKNVSGEPDLDWFDYPNFRKWPFPKRGRIIGTSTNVAESGAIKHAMGLWVPDELYTSEPQKAGKPYISQYRIGSMDWDVMNYNQAPEEFAGPTIGIQICDEPSPASIMGETMARFSEGGVLLISATMEGEYVGALLDFLDDLRDQQNRIVILAHDIEDDCTTHGIPNHKGTKRGHRTHEQIQAYSRNIPKSQQDARLHGKFSHKAGKVYDAYDDCFHVVNIDLDHPILRQSNTFMVMDPGRKYYPACTWWARTPPDFEEFDWVCFNEWPTRDLLGMPFHEARVKLQCPYIIEELAQFFKIMDSCSYGIAPPVRIMDPYFAKGTEGEFGRKTESLITLFAQHLKPEFQLPPFQRISVQRDRIQEMLRFDPKAPPSPWNRRTIAIASHCTNMRTAWQRHYFEEGREKESQQFKDFADTPRYLFAFVEDTEFDPNRTGDALRAKGKQAGESGRVTPFPGGDFGSMIKETALV